MIDVDAIAKECERMIGDGCGHIPVIGCGKASEVAELIVMLRDASEPKCFTGKKVVKVGGSFQHTGVVVAEFKTTLGQRRVVVEFDEPVSGMLHIYRTDQVDLIGDKCAQ